MTTAADLVASAFETFFSSSSATFDVVTYRTLSRKFAVTAQVGKRLLWTILNAMPREEREKWTCVVYVSRERRVELKRLEEEEEGNEFEGEDVAVYALVRKREEENVLEQLVREEEKETKMQLDSEEDVSWMLKHGAFAKSDVAKRLPRGEEVYFLWRDDKNGDDDKKRGGTEETGGERGDGEETERHRA